jgi:hypothetical protein
MNKQEGDDIFYDDLLDRKQFITKKFAPCCSALLGRGGVLAVHAPFGYGKSKFAQYYKEHFNKEKNTNRAIIIDAFLHDYTDNPFIAIHKSIGELVGYDEEMNKLGREILKASVKEVLSLVPILRKFNLSNKLFKRSLEQIIKQYIERLKKLASNKPITIIIDELDRCRPDYAVCFLERIKHYFRPVPNILFILMINKDHLFQSIKYVYGMENKEDAASYFEKFLSYRIIELPLLSEEELKKGQSVEKESSFSYNMLQSKIQKLIENNKENEQSCSMFIETASAFLHALDLNYRYHEQVDISIDIHLKVLKKAQLFTEDTARRYAYLLVLSLGRPDIFKMLQEGKNEGHELAYNLFTEIESKFCAYGNHIPVKDENGKKAEEDIRGFFNYWKDIHYLAIEENVLKKPNERTEIVDKLKDRRETQIYGFDALDTQTIKRQFVSWTQNIL